MAQFDFENLPSVGAFRLQNEIDDSTAVVTVILEKIQNAPALQNDNTPGNDTFLTELPLTIDADQVTNNLAEEYWLYDGIDLGDDRYQYSAIRGIPNGNTDNPPTSGLTRNYRQHNEGAFCVVDETWLTRNLKKGFDDNVANRSMQTFCFDGTTDVTVGDGRVYMSIPSKYDGDSISRVFAQVITAGTTNATTVQIYNVTNSEDILSTPLTIASTETTDESGTGTAVINTSTNTVSTDDLLRIDVDTASTTPAKGLIVLIELLN